MIVACPSCKKKYRVDDGSVKAPYQKMRCSLCGHVFVYETPGTEELPEDPALSLQSREESEDKKKSHKALWIFLISALVLLGLAAGLYYYWENYLGAADRWLSIPKMEGQEIIAKDGRIFLVSGMVANGSTKARKYVVLKAKLFDREGKVLGEQNAVAGMVLSREEIPHMRKADIDEKVREFRRGSVEAFSLDRRKEMPFSIALLEGDFSQAKEFTVEIIDSPFL